MRGRGRAIAGNPVLDRRGHRARRDRRRLPLLQRQPGPALRPDLPLEAETPSAANLVVGNEVRIGGARVGAVDAITAARADDGTSVAVLGLKLEQAVAPLPRDSTVLIRPRSALGLKYVELTRGTSDEGFADGDTIPLANAPPAPVEFDDFLNMFDDARRARHAANLRGLRRRASPAAARTSTQTIGSLPPAAARRHPGRAQPRRARTGLRPLHRGAGRDARASSRRSAVTQARAVRRTSTRRSARCARSRAASPGGDRRGAADARRRDPRLPAPAPVAGRAEGLFARPAPRRARAARRRRRPRRALDAARRRCAARRRSTTASAVAARRVQGVRRRPAGAARASAA